MVLFDDIFRNKKILITGDTGFKGSWLAIWLNELGAEIYGYALPPKTNLDNFVKAGLGKIVQHKDADIRNKDLLQKYFADVQPDITFHLAAQPLVIESYLDPYYTFETNLMGTVNFFEAVRQTTSVKVAINVTSDKCYLNDDRKYGYAENDPIGGKDPYSASKGCSELITKSYLNSFFKDTGCNIASVRAGNVIGAGDWADHRIVPDYFKALQKDKRLIIRNPNATRPWQHVLEPLSGYLFLASKLLNDKKYSGGWNFGPKDEKNYTVRELLDEIGKIEKSVNIVIENDSNNFHEANILNLNIAKAILELGWNPLLNFQQTVEITVRGYLSDLNNQSALEDRVNTIKKYIEIGKNQKIKRSN